MYKIDAGLHSQNDIQIAAYQVLQKWLNGQIPKKGAYFSLLHALRENGMGELAVQLKKYVDRSRIFDQGKHVF